MKKLLLLVLGLIAVSAVLAGPPSSDWDKSTMNFTITTGSCSEVTARVCNVGSDMNGTSTYEVYYNVSGNPKEGSIVDSGIINALVAGECQVLSYDPVNVEGNYMFKAYQRPGHPGEGVLWSDAIEVGSCTNEIPEFTTIGAGIALLGTGIYLYKKRN